MVIEFSFPDPSVLAPDVSIREDEKCYRVVIPRWVQFLAILAHRRLNNIENGLVTLEDCTGLIAFAKLHPKAIGKYLASGSGFFHPPASTFLRKYLRCTTTGPYQLLIQSNLIQADQIRLEQYIKFVFRPAPSHSFINQEFWKLSREALGSCELSTAQSVLTHCLQSTSLKRDLPSYFIPLIHINQANVEYLANSITPRLLYLLKKARETAISLPTPQMRDLLLAYALATEAWISPMDRLNTQRVIEINLYAIELAKSLPKKNPDRAALLAGRHYHRVYSALRFGTFDMVNDEMKLVLDLCNHVDEVDQANPHKLILYEPGLPKVLSLQLKIMQSVNSDSYRLIDQIAEYESCRDDPTIAKINALSIAEWITHSLIRINRHDQAAAFLAEELVAHAALHETALYRRLASLRRILVSPPKPNKKRQR